MNFQALGCRLNEAEIEQWSQQYQHYGHEITTDVTAADLIVFNSCAVTTEADKKSKKLIKRLHNNNADAQLLVTGCHATLNKEILAKNLGVDLVISNDQKNILVEQSLDKFKFSNKPSEELISHSIFKRGRQRAFIKVQDGCRYRCTFCIVTVARGAEVSREKQAIIDEIKLLHSQGVQECVLTGVHVGGYGSDIGSDLYSLVSDILDKTTIPRVRFASVEPWDLPEKFFDLFKNPRLMPHMHLPLQSGSDSVLRRMARRCKTNEFAELVDKARTAVEGFNVTSDIIVGFPGETDSEWQQSVEFIKKIGFGGLHIFTYSPREGTKAAGLPNQIENSIKKERSKALHLIDSTIKKNVMSELLGSVCSVMWESETHDGSGRWQGHTPHFHKVVVNDASLKASQISNVRIEQYLEDEGVLLAVPEKRDIIVNF
ncbi:MAG: tRNA (N(6)-L-threonylcarbamoyladenosine(37)-C(2))-methylthiotransferase MtaB [Gammaproteobacteria bacterium]|nr:tRNA (N(6)-L-threonylcarbamoyladenosine(37)-C(2))-methylthiotransferase MtaB [Gammaproteobacteria bacterium]